MLVQIKDNKNFSRDIESGALLNTNIEELKAYYAEREIKLKEMEEKQSLKHKVEKLENDISEMKSILLELAKKI
jgi:hypothetical protein